MSSSESLGRNINWVNWISRVSLYLKRWCHLMPNPHPQTKVTGHAELHKNSLPGQNYMLSHSWLRVGNVIPAGLMQVFLSTWLGPMGNLLLVLQGQRDTSLELSVVILPQVKRNLLKRKANIKEVEPRAGNRKRERKRIKHDYYLNPWEQPCLKTDHSWASSWDCFCQLNWSLLYYYYYWYSHS